MEWIKGDGSSVRITGMDDGHLVNAVGFIERTAARVGGNPWGVPQYSRMLEELANRGIPRGGLEIAQAMTSWLIKRYGSELVLVALDQALESHE